MPKSTPVPMSNLQSNSAPAPVRGLLNSSFGPSAKDVAQRHAELLLAWLMGELQGVKDREFSTAEMQVSYGELCAEKKLSPRAWNSVAAAFAKLTRKRGRPVKTYRRFVDRDGKNRRRRVYIVPDKLSI